MRGRVVKFALPGALVLLVSGCALTTPATNVTSTTARFHATGTYDGSDAHLYFEYSTNRADIGTPAAQRTPTVNLPAKPAGTPGSFDQSVSGLQPDTKYYYDLCGADAQIQYNGGDTCDGREFSLVTLPATAQPVTVNGPMATGTITTPGHFATFSFAGQSGQVVAPLYKLTGLSSSMVSLTVQDDAGNQLPSTHDTYTLPADGTYTVVVDGGGGTGSIRLGVYDASPRTATVNGPSTDVPVIAGQQTTVSFPGTAGDRVRALITAPTSDNSYISQIPTVTLEDPSGSIVDGPKAITSLLVGTLPTTGTYKLVFDSMGSTGLTSLSLATIQDEHGTITVNGPSVTVNISTLGQRDLLSFNGTAGQVVGLTFGPTTYGDLPPDLVQIQDASGASIPGDNYTYTLPSTETYNVVIGTAPGSASLKLSSPPVQTLPGTIIANGPIVNLDFPTPTSTKSVTFTGSAGEQVTIGTAVVQINTVGSGLPIGSIKDASGATLPGGSGPLPGVLGPVTLPSDGTYTFEVDVNNAGTGTIAAHLTTPESGSGAPTARSAPRAGTAGGPPLKPADCPKPTPATRLRRVSGPYYYGRDAWCDALRAKTKQ